MISLRNRISKSPWLGLALILASIGGLFQLLHWWQDQRLTGELESSLTKQTIVATDVVMYSTSSCPYCAKARSWLKSNHVPFTECNIEHEARCKAEFEKQGAPGVPLMQVRGHRQLGFDAQWLILALQVQQTKPKAVTSPRP